MWVGLQRYNIATGTLLVLVHSFPLHVASALILRAGKVL